MFYIYIYCINNICICVCVFIYTYKYTHYTHIKPKTFILDAVLNYTLNYNVFVFALAVQYDRDVKNVQELLFEGSLCGKNHI